MENLDRRLSSYDFDLPESQIAQTAAEPRDSAKLLVYSRATGQAEDRAFRDITEYLQPGDVLVRNATRVIPARLYFVRQSGARHEVFLTRPLEDSRWEAMIDKSARVKAGEVLTHMETGTQIEVIDEPGQQTRVIKPREPKTFWDFVQKVGEVPLPKYIKARPRHSGRYQTVYAEMGTSVAAPTAGLHWTPELLEKVRAKGVEIVDVFLDVGLGTFKPVQVDDITDHKMHSEGFTIPDAAAQAVNAAKKEGRRVVAVGTTTVRALESAWAATGLQSGESETNIFIYPGYEFRVVDALITNFHLPKSSLLMMISAFIGDRQKTLDLYQHAIESNYRFYSFGDSSFII